MGLKVQLSDSSKWCDRIVPYYLISSCRLVLSVCFEKIIWAVSDNGSTSVLQAEGKSSILLRSTKFCPLSIAGDAPDL